MDAVDAAFLATPRAQFLPESQRRRATHDGPLDIGHRQTCSQPRTVENMLRLLEVRRGQRVLDVGAGSGWTTALLAELTGPQGVVVGVEVVPELVEAGAANLAGTGREWATIEAATAGVLGVPERAPYDRILVSADAGRLPEELVAQLAKRGRMVIPVAGTMLLVVRAEGTPVVSRHGSYRFVPLL